ncbi:MAG: M23 family metallopeptidase [Magnetococcales bacterium]|nr:M23 family metallopeptidase [Magnetococcales bacterium]
MRPLTLLLTLVATLFGLTATASAAQMTIYPPLAQGAASLLTISEAPAGSRFTGAVNGVPFPISASGHGLIALDMSAKPGTRTVKVTITAPNHQKEVLKKGFRIKARDYNVERIDGLPKKKVDLDNKDLTRAGGESKKIKATYKRRTETAFFSNGFRMPATGRFSGVFGSRRILNGKSRRPHNGVDIAAPTGTPITAIAPGIVALVGDDYFFTGNTVVLDHGHGAVSLYAHMDEIFVKEGEILRPDTIIGKIGMTGRVTGPHLHMGVLVRGARVDPMKLPGIYQKQ